MSARFIRYTLDGVKLTHDIGFGVTDDDGFDVYVNRAKLDKGLDYDVIGSVEELREGDGKITLKTAHAASDVLLILSDTLARRVTNFAKAARFEEEEIDNEFDNLLRLLEDAALNLQSTPYFSPPDIGLVNGELPPLIAGGVLRVNEHKNGFELVELDKVPEFEEALRKATEQADRAGSEADKSAESASEAKNIADSIGANPIGNYKGLWPDSGGSAKKEETWQTQVGGKQTGLYFTALRDTTLDPVGDNTNWRAIIGGTSISEYTNIAFRSMGGKSAIENLIAGLPISTKDGCIASTGHTTYTVNTLKGIPLNNGLFAWPENAISLSDAGGSMNPADDSTDAFARLLTYAKQSNMSIYLPETGFVANWYTVNGEHEIEGLSIVGGGNQNTLITTTEVSGSLFKGTGAKKTLFRTSLSKFRVNGPGKASKRVGVDGELFSSFIDHCAFTNLWEGMRVTGACEGVSKNYIQNNGSGIRIVPEYDTMQPATTVDMNQNWVKGNDIGVHVDHEYSANPVWPQCASFGGAVSIKDSNTYQENGTAIKCNRANSYFGVPPIYFEKNTVAWEFTESSVNFLGIAEYDAGTKINNQSAIADKFKGRVELAGNRSYMRQLTSTVPTDSPKTVLSLTHENDETSGLYFDRQNKCGFSGHSFVDPRKGEPPVSASVVSGFSIWNRTYGSTGDGVRFLLDHSGAYPGAQTRGAYVQSKSLSAFGETCELSFGASYNGAFVELLSMKGGNAGGVTAKSYIAIADKVNGAAAPVRSFFVNDSGVLQYKDSTGAIKTVNLS
ncbi:hypothetical protein VP434O481_P0014 [Vibrio phage 434O48-1]|nr:hypothetical protein VP434O481_P0014 [Vibrio phage 434O48-1]